MRRGRLIAMLAPALVATGIVAPSPAAASPKYCAGHAPRTSADYQAVTDQRNASFGIGDTTSAIRLPDGRRFFTFGDTGYYNVAPNGRAGPLKGFGNNSAWVQSGRCFTLLNQASPQNASWLIPPQHDGSVYWPAASVVVGPRLYVFLNRVFLDPPFGRGVASAVAAFDLPSLALARISTIPFRPNGSLGNGAVYEGGFIYAYSSQRRSCAFCFAGSLYVARVRETQIHVPGAWRYRAGGRWVADPHAAQPVLRDAVSSTDVRRYGNGYLLVTKPLSFLGPDVHAHWSPNPVGPWRDLGSLFTVPEPPPSHIPGFTYRQAYTYSPTLLTGTRLANRGYLLSYNVNSFDPNEGVIDGRMFGPRFVSVQLAPPPAGAPRPNVTPGPSPWASTLGVDRLGRVRTANGGVGTTVPRTQHAVAVARTPTGRGGWVATAGGGVVAFGDAPYYGSMSGTHLNRPIVGMAATPTGKGYWLVATDGGIFSFGDARFYGSTGAIRLNKPILAMAASPTGHGYWFVASDGGVFNFGDAKFAGNIGPPVTAPCVGIVAAPGGYRLVDNRGNVFLRGTTHGRIRIVSSSPLVAAG
jgi:hypothetical protein